MHGISKRKHEHLVEALLLLEQLLTNEQTSKEDELLKVKTVIRECKQILFENAQKVKQRAEEAAKLKETTAL